MATALACGGAGDAGGTLTSVIRDRHQAKAAYRLLDRHQVTHQAVIAGHCAKVLDASKPGFSIEQVWFPEGFTIGTGTVALGYVETSRCEFTQAPRTPDMYKGGSIHGDVLEVQAGHIYSRLANGRLLAIPLDDGE